MDRETKDSSPWRGRGGDCTHTFTVRLGTLALALLHSSVACARGRTSRVRRCPPTPAAASTPTPCTGEHSVREHSVRASTPPTTDSAT
ncbi:hypothetical protein PLICRDRAFT_558190 [Plicaturopsis crispa FD-325 SS-3]|nr:hypothetical protein PLICRDRAFT_558190 [Plicaturopsis crispa FD-325 SS-3]